jgi:nucleotide-binding universal stress UspA family protein
MFRSLLVPLDRSEFAEEALPLALSIARRAHAGLELVKVHSLYALEDSHASRLRFEPELDAAYRKEEQLYLDAIAKRLMATSTLAVTTKVLSGSAVQPVTVADSILDHARTSKNDLIVIATHGRGTLGRLGIGSVADELVRRARVPVLLVRHNPKLHELASEPIVDNLVIPLDGSALAEKILTPAMDLARAMEARCVLVRVTEPTERQSEPGVAEAYLDGVATRLLQCGVQVSTKVVEARHAAPAIVAEAEKEVTNLIALATHGRGGLERLLLGSVADQLVCHATSPVLVYHPDGVKSSISR